MPKSTVDNMAKPWKYKCVDVYPADRNSSGIRWYAHGYNGYFLRTDTKKSMRQQITEDQANTVKN
jgi:hypothetical protein